MQIAVLVKAVPEPESRLRPSADGRTLDPEGIKWVLAGYDESAVEQALTLKEAHPGSTVRAISFGAGAPPEEALRAALALGCDAATLVERPEGLAPDLVDTARAIALAVRAAPYDLVLLGKQSGDEGEGCLATALAARLGWTGFGSIVRLAAAGAPGRFELGRARERGLESWRVDGPVVVGLQQADHDPRAARLQMILRSRRMPIDRVPAVAVAAELGTERRCEPVRFERPPPRTGAKMITGPDPDAIAAELLRALREEAKVL